MNTATVASVVVTRNRLDQLQHCIARLEHQTHPLTGIYVVDVASTDATPRWLEQQASPSNRAGQPPLTGVRLERNVGGAGGFYTGMQRAHADGHEWIWLMDDDGFPAPDALEKLLVYQKEARFLNSLVVQAENPDRLVWSLWIGAARFLSTKFIQDKNRLVAGASPFNGTLLHRDLIANIGYPARELFIWGDEQEYMRRAQRYGFQALTVTNSLFFHPPFQGNIKNVPPERFWRFFYLIRNLKAEVQPSGKVRLARRAPALRALAYLRILGRQPVHNRRKILIVLRAVWAAWRNDLRPLYP